MATALVRAINVLNTPLKIEGSSSASLAAEINSANRSVKDAKLATPVPTLNRPLRVTAAQALLQLAQASRNPKDRSVSAAYQWWAFLRYLAFFDMDNSFLVVGAEGRSFVNNQRRVASEELGVAFSLLVGRRWVDSLHGPMCLTSVTDVELALAGNLPSVAQLPGRTKRPDWILAVRDPGSPFVVTNYMLESKGTATDTHARRQLVKAARQLTAVSVNGAVPTGLAVSTITGTGRIRYVALDPEGEREAVTVDPDQVLRAVETGARRPRQSRVDRTAEYLASASVYWSLIGLADFARNGEALESLGAIPRAMDDSELTVRGRETPLGPVDGVERSWRVPDGRLSIVVGVASEVNEQLGRGDVAGTLEAQSRWAQQQGGRRDAETLPAEGSEPERGESDMPLHREDEAIAASSEGAILSVQID